MKTLKFLITFIVILIAASAAKAQFIKADLQVSGLTCSMCQLATQKALKTLDFVSDIKPDLNKNIYVLTFRKDKAVNLDLIKKKVKDAGFSVSKLIATFNFDHIKVSDNFHYQYSGNTYHFMNVPSKLLDGNVQIKVLDKDFISSGDFKKYAGQTEFPCYKSGVMGNTRVYHVTI